MTIVEIVTEFRTALRRQWLLEEIEKLEGMLKNYEGHTLHITTAGYNTAIDDVITRYQVELNER